MSTTNTQTSSPPLTARAFCVVVLLALLASGCSDPATNFPPADGRAVTPDAAPGEDVAEDKNPTPEDSDDVPEPPPLDAPSGADVDAPVDVPARRDCVGCEEIGTLNGRCRSSVMECNVGLVCHRNMRICVVGRPAGSPCSSGDPVACADGTACSHMFVCTPLGSVGTACRATEPRCDTGLYCARDFKGGRYCSTRVAVGSMCAGAGELDPCADGSHCVESRCVVDGGRGAMCRSGATPCDAGLTCISGRCFVGLGPGDPCSSNPDGCPATTACVRGSDGSFRCRAPGSDGAACRAAAPRCDTGFACTTTSGMRCVPEVALGGRCDAFGQANLCAAGTACVSATCVGFGARFAPCRPAAPRCDAGLACETSANLCYTALAEGAPCGPGSGTTCGEGLQCALRDLSVVCVRNGSPAAACTSASNCDAGLACIGSRCVRVVAVGATCDPVPSVGTLHCAAGVTCRHAAGVGWRCVSDGSLGGVCRATAPPCNAGLRCSLSPEQCVPEIATGAPCDTNLVMNRCAPTADCVGPSGDARCRVRGALNGRCDTGNRCDVGLTCHLESPNLCLPPIAPGSACVFETYPTRACAMRSYCAISGGRPVCIPEGAPGGYCFASGACSASGSSCVGSRCSSPAGTERGPCRSLTPRCDANLACGPDSICRFAVADGGECDVLLTRNACIPPARCVAMGLRGVCMR